MKAHSEMVKKSDEQRKADLEKTRVIVDGFINNLARYYDMLGLEGLVTITDPTIDQLLNIINQFENKANEFFAESTKSENEDYSEINEVMNLKQGLLFARGLIVSAIERNKENCEHYRNNIR